MEHKASKSHLFSEGDAKSLAEAALRSITLSTSRFAGEQFFNQLVKELAIALDVYYVIAGEGIIEDGVEKIRTLAVWAGDSFLPNMTYSLADTPCRNVADQSMCFHPCNIQKEYPDDLLLAEMKAESYIGMPMVGTDGKTLGTLVALDVRAMDEDKRLLALSLLSIFSARCAAELEHQRREAELESLVRQRTQALEEARDRLIESEKLAALGGLVAGIAHEINTPVGIAVTASSSIGDFVRSLENAVEQGKISRSSLHEVVANIRQGAELVQRNLERASALISNFKQLAADQTHAEVSVFPLLEYLNMLANAHLPELRKAHVEVHCLVDEGLRVRLSAGMLAQIVSNLLMNALVHAFPGRPNGVVTISAVAQGQDLVLQVADNGVGVPPEVRARMLEPFFTTRRGQGGTGLGLHIVYTMVRRQGGALSLASEPGQGLTVTIRLPGCVVGA